MAFTFTTTDLATVLDIMALIAADDDIRADVRTDYTPYSGATPIIGIVGDEAHQAFIDAIEALTDPAPVRTAMETGPETDSMGLRTIYIYKGLSID